jgi:CheY-like chemotaxis protein
LLDTALTPEQTTYAKAVKTSGDTLLSLIEEILDFSKIEAGRLDLEAKAFNLRALVEETVELVAPRAHAKHLDIASYVDDSLPSEVVGDATRLRQVLLNLAGNAIKFTERGGVTVIVTPGQSSGEICFLIRDTGIGIASEQQDRIFREFEQADSGSMRRFAGSGLGLAISKRIIERMDGRIGVDSAPGAGATFHVAVPLPRSTDVAVTDFSPPHLTGMDILLVAPATIAMSLLARRLDRWGANTHIVHDNKAAAELLAAKAWGVVFVDHALGRDTCATLVRAAVSAAPRRIVLVTPPNRHELPALKQAGFTGYLVKPVRAASLAARLTALGDGFEQAPGETVTNAISSQPHGPEGLRILVAEDNEINALLAHALLERLGHRPTVTADGADAVEAWLAARAAGKPFDIVLMDVHMPGSDGIEATRHIRAAEALGDARRTPIIALTANAFAEDRNACLAAGMDGLLTKPLERERLTDALAAAVAPLAA